MFGLCARQRKKLYYAYSTKKTDKYTSLNQVRKNKYCSRLIALRQAEAPLGEGAGTENPKSSNFFLLKDTVSNYKLN